MEKTSSSARHHHHVDIIRASVPVDELFKSGKVLYYEDVLFHGPELNRYVGYPINFGTNLMSGIRIIRIPSLASGIAQTIPHLSALLSIPS